MRFALALRKTLGPLTVALLAAGLVATAGCAKRGKGISKVDKEMLKAHILDDLPGDVPHKVDVNFEDKIHLVGWKAEPENAAPGSTVNFTLYWRRTGDLDPGWKLFTHVTTDNTNDAKGNLDCVGAIRQDKAGQQCSSQLYGPSEWEKGKVILDTFSFTVPTDITWPTYRFLVGIWKDDARLQIKNKEAADDQNRGNVIVLPTGVKAPEPPPTPQKAEVPSLTAPKFGKNEIKIDGKLDEAAWLKAGNTGPFVQPGDGKPSPDHPVAATAKVGWDETNLYVGFVVADKDPTSPFKPTDKDPRIWEKSSAVELMIQPGERGDNKRYFELQVDVAGAIFDTSWDDYVQPVTGGPDEATKVFGHTDWSSNLKQAVTVDKGKSWTVEIAIPWTSFKVEGMTAELPPKSGDSWRVDLYSFRDGQKAALAWSPLMGQGNFHRTSRFGKITFIDPAAPPPAASASGSASALPSASVVAVPVGSVHPPAPSAPMMKLAPNIVPPH